MKRDKLIHSLNQLPGWGGVAFVTRAARLVQKEFNSWMRDQVYANVIEDSLRFAEQCAVLGANARIPLNHPSQFSKLAFAAAKAAKSIYEDDLDPDSRPSGYAAYSYAAANAAEAAAYAVLCVGSIDRLRNLELSIAASFQANKYSTTKLVRGYEDIGVKSSFLTDLGRV